jgi:dextranase
MAGWYDFLVRYGDLLLSPHAVDVTRSYTGGINEDVIFTAPDGVRVSTDPEPGTVWVRVVRTELGLVLHLINLTGQQTVDWDAAKNPIADVTGIELRVLRTMAMGGPLVASPDGPVDLQLLEVSSDGLYDVIALPTVTAWTMVVLPEPSTWTAG